MQRLMMLLFFQVDLELQRICECNIATDELKHKKYIVGCQLILIYIVSTLDFHVFHIVHLYTGVRLLWRVQTVMLMKM